MRFIRASPHTEKRNSNGRRRRFPLEPRIRTRPGIPRTHHQRRRAPRRTSNSPSPNHVAPQAHNPVPRDFVTDGHVSINSQFVSMSMTCIKKSHPAVLQCFESICSLVVWNLVSGVISMTFHPPWTSTVNKNRTISSSVPPLGPFRPLSKMEPWFCAQWAASLYPSRGESACHR